MHANLKLFTPNFACVLLPAHILGWDLCPSLKVHCALCGFEYVCDQNGTTIVDPRTRIREFSHCLGEQLPQNIELVVRWCFILNESDRKPALLSLAVEPLLGSIMHGQLKSTRVLSLHVSMFLTLPKKVFRIGSVQTNQEPSIGLTSHRSNDTPQPKPYARSAAARNR